MITLLAIVIRDDRIWKTKARCKDQGAKWIPTLGPLGATELLVPNFGTTRHSIGPHLGTQLYFSSCVAGGNISYLAEDLILRIYNFFIYFLGPKVQEYRLDKLMASVNFSGA